MLKRILVEDFFPKNPLISFENIYFLFGSLIFLTLLVSILLLIEKYRKNKRPN